MYNAYIGLLSLLSKMVRNANLEESDLHPSSLKTPAAQYQFILKEIKEREDRRRHKGSESVYLTPYEANRKALSLF